MASTAPSAVRPDYDVIVVGFGPVGQTLSILLAQAGHRVAVVERWAAVYPKPRAVVFDAEVARVFAAAGIADRFDELGQPATEYVWQNATGQILLDFPLADRGRSGWPGSINMNQPLLEEALTERAAKLPNITLYRSADAVQLSQPGEHVEVVISGALLKHKSITATYVVGCDGANSFVRQHMETAISDLGFFYDWLIVDVVERQPRAWSPQALQVCDPARPTTLVPGGPGRRRWEFMRMPSDVLEQFDRDETAWQLLARWDITPDNATLEKRAVYTFQARWVDRWREGRLMIAGDAAHLMPPFAGQGMCSGIRDAANLAWKLDLVLRGMAEAELLDSYSSERAAHVRHAIMMSVELGKIICATDPEIVAARDAHLLATGPDPANAMPPLPPARLGPGALSHEPSDAVADGVGLCAVQARVRTPDGRIGLLDDVFGVGFHVLVDATRVTAGLTAHAGAEVLTALGATVVPLVPAGRGDGVEDLEDRLLPALAEAGHVVQIVRPDGYVFGGAADEADVEGLLAVLTATLHVAAAVPAQVR